jgi:hypothetical protein
MHAPTLIGNFHLPSRPDMKTMIRQNASSAQHYWSHQEIRGVNLDNFQTTDYDGNDDDDHHGRMGSRSRAVGSTQMLQLRTTQEENRQHHKMLGDEVHELSALISSCTRSSSISGEARQQIPSRPPPRPATGSRVENPRTATKAAIQNAFPTINDLATAARLHHDADYIAILRSHNVTTIADIATLYEIDGGPNFLRYLSEYNIVPLVRITLKNVLDDALHTNS